jgi:hypothetical protein
MANIPAFIPVRGEVILPITTEIEGRVGQGYSVLDGLSGAEQGTPDMTIAIAAGTVRLAYLPKSVSAGNATINASDVTLGRKDIIYINTSGAIAVHKGDNLAVIDPQGHGLWREYTSPYPKAGCPAGVPLYEVYIAPGDTHLHTDALRSIAQYDPISQGRISRLHMKPSTNGMTPATLAKDEDLAGRLHLVYPTTEALELQGGMECVGDIDGNANPLCFRASSDDDSSIRSTTNKAWRVEIEYFDGAGGNSGTIHFVNQATPQSAIVPKGHGLVNGQAIYISGCDKINLNGKLWKISAIASYDATYDSFQIDGSVDNGDGIYGSTGTWYSGCLTAKMKNATPAEVITPIVVLRNTGTWKTARLIADITARCNGDYTSQGNSDLKIAGDVSGLDLYIRSVRLINTTTKAEVSWSADNNRNLRQLAESITTLTYIIPVAISITSYTWVPIDAANLTLSLDGGGGKYEILVTGIYATSTVGFYLNFKVDGVLVTNAYMGLCGTVGGMLEARAIVDLPAGAHTIQLCGRIGTIGTGSVSLGYQTQITAREIKN